MKFDVNIFKKTVSDLIKLSSFNKLLPRTSFIHIVAEGQEAECISYSEISTLRIKVPLMEPISERISLATEIIKVHTILNSTTKKVFEIGIEETHVRIKSGGSYKVPLYTLTDFECKYNKENGQRIKLDKILQYYTISRTASIESRTMFQEILKYSYISNDAVLGTDNDKALTIPSTKLFEKDDFALLVDPVLQTVGNIFVEYCNNDNMKLIVEDDYQILSSDDGSIFYKFPKIPVDLYPSGQITSLLNVQFSNYLLIEREEFLRVLNLIYQLELNLEEIECHIKEDRITLVSEITTEDIMCTIKGNQGLVIFDPVKMLQLLNNFKASFIKLSYSNQVLRIDEHGDVDLQLISLLSTKNGN